VIFLRILGILGKASGSSVLVSGQQTIH